MNLYHVFNMKNVLIKNQWKILLLFYLFVPLFAFTPILTWH